MSCGCVMRGCLCLGQIKIIIICLTCLALLAACGNREVVGDLLQALPHVHIAGDQWSLTTLPLLVAGILVSCVVVTVNRSRSYEGLVVDFFWCRRTLSTTLYCLLALLLFGLGDSVLLLCLLLCSCCWCCYHGAVWGVPVVHQESVDLLLQVLALGDAGMGEIDDGNHELLSLPIGLWVFWVAQICLKTAFLGILLEIVAVVWWSSIMHHLNLDICGMQSSGLSSHNSSLTW